LAQVGVLYDGLATLGGGATLAGIILGAITVFIIDRAFDKAAAFALAGTVLTFFGFIHGAEGIGVNSSPAVAVSYLAVAGILFYLSRYAEFHPMAMEAHGGAVAAEAD
jgi:AGZA family xanthine/uracil permease-like MFS transporter